MFLGQLRENSCLKKARQLADCQHPTPHELSQRLDRYLDWSEFYRRVKSSRNAAIREALSQWLDDQEQRAGFLDPQAQREQFRAAYRSVAKRHDWVDIHRLRQLLPWPRERFDTVLEGLIG